MFCVFNNTALPTLMASLIHLGLSFVIVMALHSLTNNPLGKHMASFSWDLIEWAYIMRQQLYFGLKEIR